MSADSSFKESVADTVVQLTPPNQGDLSIRVPIGAKVVILAPGIGIPALEPARMIGLAWHKDDIALPLPQRALDRLVLSSARVEDSGSYRLTNNNFQLAMSSRVSIQVGDEPVFRSFASPMQLKHGDDTRTRGFFVPGTKPKTILIRTVGDSLRALGIERVAERPRFQLRDVNGGEVFLSPRGIARPAGYWEAVFSRAGAFPLLGSEEAGHAFDAGELQPGWYSIHVSDSRKVGGAVLVEAYEVPAQK